MKHKHGRLLFAEHMSPRSAGLLRKSPGTGLTGAKLCIPLVRKAIGLHRLTDPMWYPCHRPVSGSKRFGGLRKRHGRGDAGEVLNVEEAYLSSNHAFIRPLFCGVQGKGSSEGRGGVASRLGSAASESLVWCPALTMFAVVSDENTWRGCQG